MKYWLMKSEPTTFSIDDLKKSPKKTTCWDGVRNYQARNFMHKEMKVGDQVLFYHSNCSEIGVVGLAEVSKEAYPDHTAWDKKSKYYDEKSSTEKPRWFMVDIKWLHSFKRVVTLEEIKKHPGLKSMLLIKKGQRLSVQPVSRGEYSIIKKLGG